MGGQGFCAWVEEQQQKLGQFQAPEEIRMRRREVGIDPEVILETVGQVCGVEGAEFRRRHSRHPGRRVAMKLLMEMGDLSGREVARRMGLTSSAAVSRHLQAQDSELPRNPALARLLEEAGRQIRSVQGQ
jgi:hypothetical protein